MRHAEAGRQFQAALEAQRSLQAHLDGVLSAQDLLDDAAAAVEDCRKKLFETWISDR